MKGVFVISIFIILLMFSILACNENSTEPSDEITAKPVVKKTLMNYTSETFSFPDSSSLNNISKAYSNNFSEQVRSQLIDYMKNEVSKLGEDVGIFDNILSRTFCNAKGEYILPTYAERAKYEGKEAWIFQLTYGLDTPDFGHFKCFAFDLETLDTLNYIGCR